MRPVVAAILLQFANRSTRPGDGLSTQLMRGTQPVRGGGGRGEGSGGDARSFTRVSPGREVAYSPRWNGMKPSRFGIFTWGSVFASSVSFSPITPLRLRM
jgi:hypothetical protein